MRESLLAPPPAGIPSRASTTRRIEPAPASVSQGRSAQQRMRQYSSAVVFALTRYSLFVTRYSVLRSTRPAFRPRLRQTEARRGRAGRVFETCRAQSANAKTHRPFRGSSSDRWCVNPFSHPARGNPFPRPQCSSRFCILHCGDSPPRARQGSRPPFTRSEPTTQVVGRPPASFPAVDI